MLERRLVLVALLAASVLGACGDGDDDGDGAADSAAGGSRVTVENSAFSPQSVSAEVGDSVTWTFEDSFAHTVTADDQSFDSGARTNGDTFEHTFTSAGTFPYKCTIHPSMTGTVTVS